MAIKSIPKDKVEILIKDLQEALKFINNEREPWVSVGYTKASMSRIISQLNGEFPII